MDVAYPITVKLRLFFFVLTGGGKIWECTQDLGDYFMGSNRNYEGDSLYKISSGKHVLDLGCGAGLLGILALKAGAIVHFSDYVSILMLRRSSFLNMVLLYAYNGLLPVRIPAYYQR